MKPKRRFIIVVLTAWTVGVILIAHALRDVIGGQFKEHWFLITALVLVVGSAFIEFLRWVARLAQAGSDHPQEPAPIVRSQVRDSDKAIQGRPIMTGNPKVIIQSSGVVNVHHNSGQGGIIGYGTVHVHQHFEERRTGTPETAQDAEPATSGNLPSGEKTGGANPPNQANKKLVRKILEDNPDGLDAIAIYSQMQLAKAAIPDWVTDETDKDIRSYISTFIAALKDDLKAEGKDISSRPYRIRG